MSGLLALALGLCTGRLATATAPKINESLTQRYTTTVLGCDAQADGFDCTVQLESGFALLAYFAHAPQIGERIVVRARLEPFDAPRNPGEPDQREIEKERGLSGRLEGAAVLQDLGRAPMSLPLAIALSHVAASERIHRFLSEPDASIVSGELWGERATLPPELRSEFQDTGTVHVLVTAGLHLGVIALVLMGALKWAGAPRVPACIVCAAAIWACVLFSGAHLPAVRAGTMFSFALCARAVGAKALSWNALSAAAIAIVITSPQSILGASFAMSFSCVGAILLLAPLLDCVLQRVPGLPARVREVLTLTLATQAGVWPLTAATFLLYAPYAILANAAVVPTVGITMILGAAQIVLADVAGAGRACANLNAWFLQFMLASVRLTSQLPAAHIVMTPAPLWAICSYDCALILAVWLIRNGALTAACALLLVAAGTIITPPRAVERTLQITMLDVGQADAIVIRTPAGHVLLVDAGGRLERGAQTSADSTAERVGERIVVPYLIRQGIHHVDALLLSHPHGDHAGGLAPVLRGLGADRFADSGQQYGGFAYRDAISVARAHGTPTVYPRAGTIWRTKDGVSLTFLGPQVPFITASRNDINNNSLVFMLQYDEFKMLFTGDAGAEAERRILAEGIDLRSTVLKVGHHGSAYSSTPEFIEAIRPKYAIISVGRHNLFGHPAPSTIDTLERFGARVYRTDEDGATTLRSDGKAVEISTMARV